MFRCGVGTVTILWIQQKNMKWGVQTAANDGEGAVRAKKFPTPECYESGEVKDGMKQK